MSGGQKTIARILAECRKDAHAMDKGIMPAPSVDYLCTLLDRIEAAAKRERERNSKRLTAREIKCNKAILQMLRLILFWQEMSLIDDCQAMGMFELAAQANQRTAEDEAALNEEIDDEASAEGGAE